MAVLRLQALHRAYSCCRYERSKTSSKTSAPPCPAIVLQARCIAEVTAKPEAATSKPSFDFKRYMGERAELIDAALDQSVPMQVGCIWRGSPTEILPLGVAPYMAGTTAAGYAAAGCMRPAAHTALGNTLQRFPTSSKFPSVMLRTE